MVFLFGCALGATLAFGAKSAAAAHTPTLRPLVVLPRSVAVTALPDDAAALEPHPYNWPLQPFDRPHAIRGAFGDPRFGALQRNFHFGIDIPAPDWTRVYAVAPGTVYLEPDHVDVLTNVSARNPQGFAYWHIVAAVAEHAFLHRHALVGWVSPAWHHLHFAELRGGRWLNPLRPGALTPSAAPTEPHVAALTVAPSVPATGESAAAAGHVDVVADVSVAPTVAPPAPWQEARFVPALVRWRVLLRGTPVSGWRTAADFRYYIPPNRLFADVYAPGTTPNQPGHPGRYLLYLARDWDAAELLGPGNYVIQLEVFGSRAEMAGSTAALVVTAAVRRPRSVPG